MALLRGTDHPTLGERAVVAVDATTAVGMSAGRLPKSYWHLDPNEDAALAVVARDWTLLAVADGHNGADASHAAIAAVAAAAETAESISPTSLVEVAANAAAGAVTEAIRGAGKGREQTRTALSIAVSGGGRVAALTWGDTTVALVRAGRRTKVTPLTTHSGFLGSSTPRPPVGSWATQTGDRIVLCSDGVMDYLGGRWTDRIAEAAASSARADGLVESLLEQSSLGGAGDHQSVAATIV